MLRHIAVTQILKQVPYGRELMQLGLQARPHTLGGIDAAGRAWTSGWDATYPSLADAPKRWWPAREQE